MGGVVDPNREIGFGSVAVRCVAIALRCVAIALRCVAIALRCDAKLCVRVKRRDSGGWCFKWAVGVPCRAGACGHGKFGRLSRLISSETENLSIRCEIARLLFANGFLRFIHRKDDRVDRLLVTL